MKQQRRTKLMQYPKLVRVVIYALLLALCWLIGVYFIWDDWELRKPIFITMAVILIPLMVLGLVVGKK